MIYKGQTIEAYDNILDYQESISDPSIFFPPFLTPYAIHSIILDVNDFEFENGPYEVFAEWNSRGGQHFADTLSLLLEFE
ncbi:MAG: hypothetical protein IID15_03285 [Candidatus Marinimicrobia bacterium]|nr:hypothetical protein [Candidatus Neomarinimicrobiota bacterium]